MCSSPILWSQPPPSPLPSLCVSSFCICTQLLGDRLCFIFFLLPLLVTKHMLRIPCLKHQGPEECTGLHGLSYFGKCECARDTWGWNLSLTAHASSTRSKGDLCSLFYTSISSAATTGGQEAAFGSTGIFLLGMLNLHSQETEGSAK